jgi:DoxX-like family
MSSTIGAQSSPAQTVKASQGQIWTGRVISGLIVAFMLLDAVMKFVKPAPVAEAFARTGWPVDLSVTLGAILLICTVLYVIPRTAVLGAILLTGYLGGAVATNLRLHNPLFSNTLFPVYFGILVWIGLWLRESRLRSVFPLL